MRPAPLRSGRARAWAAGQQSLVARLQEAERRHDLLLATSLELASSLELGELLQSAACRLTAAVAIPDCDIYRLEGGETLVCLASAADGIYDATWVGERFPRVAGPAIAAPSRHSAPSASAVAATPSGRSRTRRLRTLPASTASWRCPWSPTAR